MQKHNVLIMSAIILLTTLSLGAVSATYSAESVTIGSNVTCNFAGLGSSLTYQVEDTSGQVLAYFVTGAAETTQTVSIPVAKSGINEFYLKFTTNGSVSFTFQINGYDPFDSLVYTIVPLLLAATVIGAIFGSLRRIARGN